MSSSASTEARSETPRGTSVLTYVPLNVQEIVDSVADDGAGASAVFIGTTRNSFKGNVVTKLEYQAYSKLAIKTMSDIIDTVHAQASSSSPLTPHEHTPAPPVSSSSIQSLNQISPQRLIRIAIHHRLGTVPVGQPSIVIAVSSPHRKEAFAACETILEEVKRRAQIWKREYYEGMKEEEAEWKVNV